MNVDKNRHFWTTYQPLLVHIVIECPQSITNFQHQRTDFYTCISIGFLKIFSPDCLSSWDSNVGKHSFLMIKTHYLTQKFHKWQHLIKKKTRSSIFKAAAVNSQQVNRPHYEIDCCYVWELRVRTENSNGQIIFFFSIFLFPSFLKDED